VINLTKDMKERIENFIQTNSRYGLIAAGIFVLMIMYYSTRAVLCGSSPMDCSRPMFLLTFPLYAFVASLIHFNGFWYALMVLVTGPFYALGFYEVGRFVEHIAERKELDS